MGVGEEANADRFDSIRFAHIYKYFFARVELMDGLGSMQSRAMIFFFFVSVDISDDNSLRRCPHYTWTPRGIGNRVLVFMNSFGNVPET